MLDACSTLIQKFDEAFNKLDKALKAPRKALRMLDKQVNKLTDLADFDVEEHLPDVPSSFTDADQVLASMLDCPAVAETQLGSDIEAILDAKDSGEEVPSDAVDNVESSTQGEVDKQIDNAMSKAPLGKVQELSNTYSNAVSKVKTSESFNHLEVLRDCIAAACESAEQITEQIDKLRDDSRISPVDNLAEDAVLASENVSEDLKSTYNDKTSKVQSVKDSVKDFSVDI